MALVPIKETKEVFEDVPVINEQLAEKQEPVNKKKSKNK